MRSPKVAELRSPLTTGLMKKGGAKACRTQADSIEQRARQIAEKTAAGWVGTALPGPEIVADITRRRTGPLVADWEAIAVDWRRQLRASAWFRAEAETRGGRVR